MNVNNLATPVLFLVFRRPDRTRRVFEEIRRAKPARLFVAADGPRESRPEEAELCRQTREVIRPDWPCDLHTLFRDTNLGNRANISSAVTWFFENAEEGIVLEDDCLPHPDFFSFSSALLERYRDDRRIMHISGDNFQFGRRRGEASYYFSRYAHCWGWATWRRAWSFYDLEMSSFPRFAADRKIDGLVPNRRARRYFTTVFRDAHAGRHKTWDYAWAYSVLSRGGLCAVPNANLITNIGFDEEATHTFDPQSEYANIPLESLGRLVHPAAVLPDKEADDFEFARLARRPLRRRLLDRLGRLVRRYP